MYLKEYLVKKGNESILRDFLIAVLEIPIKKIEIIKDARLERVVKESKEGVLDIKATLNTNITVNIEMQVRNEYNMINRSLYYWASLYSTNLYKNQDYIENNKTITINILDFNIFEEGPYHERCMIKRDYNNELLTKDLEIHFIQIPKCRNTEIKTELDYWMQFIGNISKDGVRIAMEKNKEIKKAQEELDYLTGDEEERRLAQLREKALRDKISGLNCARRAGIKEGKLLSKAEIAKKLKKMKINIEDIMEATGLPQEEIEKL